MIDYYKRVLRKINSIKNKNKRAEKITFGYSVLGRKIEGLFFNFNKKETFIIQASIHAREYITTSFLLKVANVVAGCDEKTTCALPNLLFIFLSNPDGVMLVKNGLKSVKNIHYNRFL